MKEILDIIVGNTFLFIGVILFLVVTFLVLIRAIVKTVNNHKIPIYEEENESSGLDDVIADDIIEKPKKKKVTEEIIEEEKSKDKDDNSEDSSKIKLEEKEISEEIIEESTKEPEIVEEEFSEDIVEEETIEEELIENNEEEEIENNEEEIIIGEEPNREELEQIEDKEIETRIDKEHEKEIKDALAKNSHEEFNEILNEMKEIKEVNPEEVVRNFEEEQEARSIISYQELVDVVKNRDNEFVDELENKPLATVSDFIEKPKNIDQDVEVLEIIEQLEKSKEEDEPKVEELLAISDSDIEQLEPSVEEIEVLEPAIIEYKKEEKVDLEPLPEIADNGRFKKTDVISPVFGRINGEEKIDYPKVEKFKREKNEEKKSDIELIMPKIELPKRKNNDNIETEKEAAEVLKSFSSMFENISEKIEEKELEKIEEDIEELESLTAISNISKNEDFLKALKDFRNNL